MDGSAALAGTAITGVNLNRSSGNVAEAEAKGDETTNSAQGTLILSPELEALKMVELDLQGSIILGTNDMLGIDFVTAGGTDTALVTVFGYYEKE